ncbi:hypothetical protein Tco_1225501, partial [Tanacetum coccineum]
TIALLIIVVVVTVVVVVVVLVTVVVVVVVVTVVVVVVVVVTVVIVVIVAVVVVGRPYPIVPGQMANLIAVTTPRPGLCSASYSVVVGFNYSWKDHHTFFSFLPDVQHRHGSSHPSTQL